jgi:hypothetical protein
MEYGKAVTQVAADASMAAGRSKKARGGSDQERALPTVRRCGNCGGTGHNARTCKKDTEDNSESELSSICTELWDDSDEIEAA